MIKYSRSKSTCRRATKWPGTEKAILKYKKETQGCQFSNTRDLSWMLKHNWAHREPCLLLSFQVLQRLLSCV